MMADNKNNGDTVAWEVVSVTDSVHTAANPLDEAKDKEPPSVALFMSGHFSLTQKSELESLLMDSDSKSALQEESCHQTIEDSSASAKTKDELDVDFMEPPLYSSEYAPSRVEEVTRNVEDNSMCSVDKGIEERKDSGCKEEKSNEEREWRGELVVDKTGFDLSEGD